MTYTKQQGLSKVRVSATVMAAVATISLAGGGIASAQSSQPVQSANNMSQMWHNAGSYDQANKTYGEKMRSLLNTAWSDVHGNSGGQQALYRFNDSLTEANKRLDDNLRNAQNNKHDQYVDNVNRAKADYFNMVEQAKNRLASDLDANGQSAAKDRLMNNFNSLKDQFGNWMEWYKNDMNNHWQ